MIKEVKNDTLNAIPVEELENVAGGTIMQSTDRSGRTVYNVYNDRNHQFVASFYNLNEAVNCNLRVNG